MKAIKVKCNIWKRKQTKTHLVWFQLFIFHKPACLEEYFHGWLPSIQVFSADGHYGLSVSLWMNTIASCDQFEPIRIWENLVVNYNTW